MTSKTSILGHLQTNYTIPDIGKQVLRIKILSNAFLRIV